MQQRCEFVLYNAERNVSYYATRRLGVGGQGGVWGGVDSAGNPVALKIMWPTTNNLHAYWSWFNDQVGHLQCLHQPHVVLSYDQFQSHQGWYVIVMEPAIKSLDDVIRAGFRQSAVRVCVIGTHILSALAFLHSINRIHRDVSAKNLLEFANGVVKLSDFGVSKGDIAAGQATGTQLGNALYLPPELLYAGRWTHQSDIYQLGLVLISLLIGRHVIPPNSTPAQMGKMILDGVPRQTAEGLIATHGDLGRILAYMVCRTERLRFCTAAAAWNAMYKEWERQVAIERARREALADVAKALGLAGGLAWLANLSSKA